MGLTAALRRCWAIRLLRMRRRRRQAYRHRRTFETAAWIGGQMSCSDALSRSPRWMRTSRHGETSLLAPNIARSLIAGLMRNNYGHDAWAQSGHSLLHCCRSSPWQLKRQGGRRGQRARDGAIARAERATHLSTE